SISTYVAAHRQYRQELLNTASRLHTYAPDTVLFSLVARDFIGTTPITASPEDADRVIVTAVEDLQASWRTAKDDLGALVIQQSFLDVEPPVFGGLDAVVPGSPSRLVAKLNAAVADSARTNGVLWLDAARASARDGLDSWFDIVRWLQGKLEISPQA